MGLLWGCHETPDGPYDPGLRRPSVQNFEADPAIAAAEIASEHRRGANYFRVTVTLAVAAADVADALTIAWDAFTAAAADDLTGWEGTAASA